MCGRYATARSRQELLDAFDVEADETWAEDGSDLLRADYNAAPTKLLPAVLDRADPTAEEAVPVRRLKMLRWGLVPSWAKDPSIGNRMINARVETVAEKPSFRRAFAKRRCLLPADGYYEWYTNEETKKKQPFFIAPADGGILPLAGLYELWKPPDDEAGDWIWTFTILTTQAVDAVGHIHDRMPMTVTDEDAWLDPATRDPGSLLVPAMSGDLEVFPVSKAVGNVRNNGPALIEPLAAEGGAEALF